MDSVTLPPDLEQFATEAVASGRFRDRDELVRTGVDLLRRRETARAEFIASLEAAQEEGRRNGFHEIDDVMAELDAIIAEEEHARA
jgi:putative addiction module CopG family antidote